MKKRLLSVSLCALAVASFAQMTVKDGTTVKVKSNTLLYSTGNVGLDTSTTTKFSNDGNVKVDGDFTSSSDGLYTNEYTDADTYGQLIVAEGKATSGKINQEYDVPDGYTDVPMTFPFKGYKGSDLATDAGLTYKETSCPAVGKCGARYLTTLFRWNNEAGTQGMTSGYHNHVYSDEIGSASTALMPYDFHLLNNRNAGWSGFAETSTAISPNTFKGVPANEGAATYNVTMTPYIVGGKGQKNAKAERFGSFIDDPIVPVTGWGATTNPNGYGDNVFQFSNPYTSNIDLSYIGLNETSAYVDDGMALSVAAVYIYDNFDYTTGQGSSGSTAGTYKAVTFSSGQASAGDTDGILIVKPQHSFLMKMQSGYNTAETFKFSDALKTFSNVARATSDADGDTGTAGRPGKRTTSTSVDDNKTYQLTFRVYNTSDEYTGNRIHIAAGKNYQPYSVGNGDPEVYYNGFGDQNGLYSLQENADGTVNEFLKDEKVQLNGVNSIDYVGLPVHVGININANNPMNEFTIKASLYENLQLKEVLSNGNMFYLEDTETNEIMEVTSDFTYTFNTTESTEDRFKVYWNDVPETLAVTDPATVKSNTIVFRDGVDFKVRFDKDWTTADVYVYNVLGQLVHSAKDVVVNSDYTIPLKVGSSAYVVKVIGDDKEVVTKKIVK